MRAGNNENKSLAKKALRACRGRNERSITREGSWMSKRRRAKKEAETTMTKPIKRKDSK